MAHAKTILDEIGLGSERLDMFHIGASDAKLFAETVTEMSDRAKRLGPNPLRSKPETM